MQQILTLTERVVNRLAIAELEKQADEAWMRQDFDAADKLAQQAYDRREQQDGNS